MQRIALALALVVAACSSPSSSHPAASPAPPAPVASDDSAAATAPAPAAGPVHLGAPCGTGDSCTAPAQCVKYYGIAGAKGGQLSSCEIRCDRDKTACPAKTHCATIMDGPGPVCRADAAPGHE